MAKVKNEKLFSTLARDDCPTSSKGGKQFFLYQSKGIYPEDPDDYFLSLMKGKSSFDFLTSEYMKLYKNREWWGFSQLWKDWEGERWILPLLCSWYPSLTGRSLPDWLDKEITIEELRRDYL